MAKIAFTKLGLTKNTSTTAFDWQGNTIEVKNYLPVEDKLNLIADIINYSADDNAFYNPCKVEIFETLKIIEKYTNINLTEKQSEDVLKLYDLYVSSGFWGYVSQVIPEIEQAYIHTGVMATIEQIYKFKNSALGILEQINTDYKDLNFDIDELEQKISNPEGLRLIKDVAEDNLV